VKKIYRRPSVNADRFHWKGPDATEEKERKYTNEKPVGKLAETSERWKVLRTLTQFDAWPVSDQNCPEGPSGYDTTGVGIGPRLNKWPRKKKDRFKINGFPNGHIPGRKRRREKSNSDLEKWRIGIFGAPEIIKAATAADQRIHERGGKRDRNSRDSPKKPKMARKLFESLERSIVTG